MTLVTPAYAPALSFHLPRIDTRSLPYLCYKDPEFVRSHIASQFELNRIGKVSRVDLLTKANDHGYLYYEAFVHFSQWFTTPQSLALRNAACSKYRKATMPLAGISGSGYYWIVNESRSKVYEEDWQSLLTAIPASRWVQAAEEDELVEYQKKRAQDSFIERWYKHIPTDEELAAVAKIEEFATKHCKPAPITCPELCHLFTAQAQYEYDQALAAVAQAEAELREAEEPFEDYIGDSSSGDEAECGIDGVDRGAVETVCWEKPYEQFFTGGWGDRCTE